MHYSSAFGYAFTSFDFGQLRSPQPENQTQPSERCLSWKSLPIEFKTMSGEVKYWREKRNKNHNKKQGNQRVSEVSLTVDETTALPKNDPNSRNDNIIWSDRRDRPIELYLHCLQEKSNRKPTPDKIKYAQDIAHTFHYFSQNKVIILDRDQDFKVIAMIEFTPLENLSASQKVKLNTVAMFLEEVKKYVSTVGTAEAIDAAPEEYDCLMQNASPQASDILGEMFKDFANVVSKKTASASREITNGEIMNRTTNRDKKPEDMYMGDHQQIMNSTA
ncbi:hypothetical protein MJO29_005575 [Puccinia striiformis f. sp. tritici]|nr:hypothetical protein MJO29_005575 [Puccinia striiformis f. sp. tritici]